MSIGSDDRVFASFPHFKWGEFAYHRGTKVYLPDAVAQMALRWTLRLFLVPLRQRLGESVNVVRGGGYDPVYDPDTGVYVSHRGTFEEGTGRLLRPSGTQHHHGGAVDFRVGATSAADVWTIDEVYAWLERRAELLGVGSVGMNLYPREQRKGKWVNNFIHIDTRDPNYNRPGIVTW